MSAKKLSKKSSGGKFRDLNSFVSTSQSKSEPVSPKSDMVQGSKTEKKAAGIKKKINIDEEIPATSFTENFNALQETKIPIPKEKEPEISKTPKKSMQKTPTPSDQNKESMQKSKDVQKKASPSPVKADFLINKIYFSPPADPIGDSSWISKFPRNRDAREPQDSWHLRILKENNQLVQNLEQGVLLTVEYDGVQNKAFAKFYDLSDHSIKIWLDSTDHHPYCYHKTSMQELEHDSELMQNLEDVGFTTSETVPKIDLLEDKTIQVTKLYGKTPTSIGGTRGMRDVLGGAWEAQIRYHHNFIYDRNLIPGMFYTIKSGKISPIYPGLDARLEQDLLKVFQSAPLEVQEIAKEYHPVFSTPIPSLRRLAFDIEVEEPAKGGLPNPLTAEYRVICVAFASNDGLRRVYCLDRPEIPLGNIPPEFPTEAEVFYFHDEKQLIQETFRLFWQYPLVLSFNGDNFDNNYLTHRAANLKIPAEINPIVIERGGGMIAQRTDFKHTIHIDLYQFFANRSIKGYAFGGVYMKNSLEDIASSLLGVGKIKHEGILIGRMAIGDLIHYNMNDAIITLNLTTFNDQVMWNLLIVLLRITKLPLQDLVRLQISAWIRSLMFYEHRRKNILIPRMENLEERGEFKREEDVTFEGAYVVDPIPGIHYNVAVLDFSSLYPSIIMTRNLSYETVKCIHPECRMNLLPNTKYWACTKKMGLFAYVVGYLREVRVKWFKPMAGNKTLPKSQRQTASVMSSALKVFINGAYGVFGSSNFPLYYLPVAESTTAIGRYSILNTIDQAKSMGITVLYGDSDSVFLLNPSKEQIQNLIAWAEKTLDLDLELDKTYQFLALSERKKNYIGVRIGGEEVDLKGLLAKKQNTPEFIKMKFQEVQDILTQITDPASFKANRDKIIKIIRQSIKLIGVPADQGGFKLEDYGITVALHRDISKYTKTTPQHIKALKQLPPDEQKKVEQGEYITFIKTRGEDGVKPLNLASLSDIDDKKYKELLRSTFEQVLDALGISYDEIQGQKKLHEFFQT